MQLLFISCEYVLASVTSLESLGLPTRVKTLKICLKGVEKFQEAYTSENHKVGDKILLLFHLLLQYMCSAVF